MKKILAGIMFFSVACAGRTATWEQDKAQTQGTMSESEAAELDKKGDALFAERVAMDKAEAATAAYSEAASKAPTADRLAKLSRAYYFLADGHYNLAGRKDDMLKTYQKGLEAGEQGLVLAAPEFA